MSSGSGVPTNWTEYLGLWYERVRIPTRFEPSASANVTAYYTLKQPNVVHILNEAIDMRTHKRKIAKGTGVIPTGVIRKNTTPGVLKVKFSPLQLFRSDYIVLDHAPDYTWSLVGNKNRTMLWFLTREKSSQLQLDTIRNLAKAKGYSEAALSKLQATPEI